MTWRTMNKIKDKNKKINGSKGNSSCFYNSSLVTEVHVIIMIPWELKYFDRESDQESLYRHLYSSIVLVQYLYEYLCCAGTVQY